MPLRIERLTRDHERAYDDLLLRIPESMIFQTSWYRDFLRAVLKSSEERYLVALEGGAVVGALPAFLMRNARYGNVLNSLPFYGSNGGVLVESAYADRARVERALIGTFREIADADEVVSSTIVSSPLAPREELYASATGHTVLDERIGQLTRLPALQSSESDAVIGAALMRLYHPKTRNVVKKGLLSGAVIDHDGSLAAMQELARLHEDNIGALGGIAKPWEVFAAAIASFEYDVDYRVYRATVDGRTIAALLVFFHGGVCEYHTPATDASFRSAQPGSLLVYTAMHEAVRRGCAIWNWGGTWLTQKGVYDFKSKWGTHDVTYRYYVRESARSELRSLDRATLLREYPYYYTVPFSVLAGA